MPPFDFPSSPLVDDEVVGTNGATYRWDGVKWVAVGGAGGGGGGILEPAVDGVYLRQKQGSAYTWENNIALPGERYTDESPLLTFNTSQFKDTAILIQTRPLSGSGAVVIAPSNTRVTTPFALEEVDGAGLWALATGNAPGLYVDQAGTRSGIIVEHGGSPQSNGIDIRRYTNAGPSIRLTHHPATNSNTTPLGHLLGNIVFAGVVSRGFPLVLEGGVRRADTAAVQAVATEQWAPGYGSRLEFLTTRNGDIMPRRALVIDHDGSLSILHNGVLTNLLEVLDARYERIDGGPTGPTVPGPFSRTYDWDDIILFSATGPSEIASLEISVITAAVPTATIYVYKGTFENYSASTVIGTFDPLVVGDDFVITLSDMFLAAGQSLWFTFSGSGFMSWLKLTLVSGEGTGPLQPRP